MAGPGPDPGVGGRPRITRTSWQWQPRRDSHDPNPPITLENTTVLRTRAAMLAVVLVSWVPDPWTWQTPQRSPKLGQPGAAPPAPDDPPPRSRAGLLAVLPAWDVAPIAVQTGARFAALLPQTPVLFGRAAQLAQIAATWVDAPDLLPPNKLVPRPEPSTFVASSRVRQLSVLLATWQDAPAQLQVRRTCENWFVEQFAGLRIRTTVGTVDVCLVNQADAPTGIGGRFLCGTPSGTKAVYLVDPSDPNATAMMFSAATIKRLRKKTP